MNDPELKVSIPIHDNSSKRAQLLVEEDNSGKNFKLDKSEEERFQYHLYPVSSIIVILTFPVNDSYDLL